MIFSNLPSGKRFNKVVSLVVAISFILSNIALADISKTSASDTKIAPQTTTDPEKIVIPRDFGIVKAKYTSKDSRKLVVHIQDAHCNYEAQSNIMKILECLIKNDGLSLISVEGADGFIDTSWFKAFPDADIRKEVADYFMKKGEITGPEFLAITSDYPVKLFGAETRSYYIENLNAFTSSYPLKEDTEKYFNQIKAVLNKLKNNIYSPDLKDFDEKSLDYESKKLSFTDYVKYLESLGARHKVNLRQYDNLFKLVSVLVYEKKIDFNVVDKERAALIDDITKKLDKEQLSQLVSKSLEFKVSKISSAEYYDYLRNLSAKYGISLIDDYPNLFNYIIYNSVYSKIENERLFGDIKKFEDAVKEKMFANDDQRTLDKLSREINILIGLVNIKLLNGDFDYYKSHKEEFTYEVFADFIKKMAVKFGFNYEIDPPSEAVTESMPKLEDFYAIAIKRDKALVDNTIQAMNKEKAQVTVLVTGGFHSEGITKLLEQKGVSYIVVCPNITKDVETPYIKILTNQRTPLEEILSDTGAAAAPDAKNVKGSMLAPILISRLAAMDQSGVREYIRSAGAANPDQLAADIYARREKLLQGYSGRGIAGWLMRTMKAAGDNPYAHDEITMWDAYQHAMEESLVKVGLPREAAKKVVRPIVGQANFRKAFHDIFVSVNDRAGLLPGQFRGITENGTPLYRWEKDAATGKPIIVSVQNPSIFYINVDGKWIIYSGGLPIMSSIGVAPVGRLTDPGRFIERGITGKDAATYRAPINPTKSATEAVKFIEEAGVIEYEVSLRGMDLGSSQDLQGLKVLITPRNAKLLSDIAQTTIIPSKFRAKIKITPLTETEKRKYGDNSIVYVSELHKFPVDNPKVFTKPVNLVNGRAPGEQKDAVAYILWNIFGVHGFKIEFDAYYPGEESNKAYGLIATEAGGMGTSGTTNTALYLLGNMLSGSGLTDAECASEAIVVENTVLGGYTGGQEGYVAVGDRPENNTVATDFVWMGGIKDSAGNLLYHPYAALGIPLSSSEEDVKFIEAHSAILQVGANFVKNEKGEIKKTAHRSASGINTGWMHSAALMRSLITGEDIPVDSVGAGYHRNKVSHVVKQIQGLLGRNIGLINEGNRGYVHERDMLSLREAQMIVDGDKSLNISPQRERLNDYTVSDRIGLATYGLNDADRIAVEAICEPMFEKVRQGQALSSAEVETLSALAVENLDRLYKNHVSLYSDYSKALYEAIEAEMRANQGTISMSAFNTGAGGDSGIIIVWSSGGQAHLEKFFRERLGIEKFNPQEVKRVVTETGGRLSGWMPFEVGKIGYDLKLGQVSPEQAASQGFTVPEHAPVSIYNETTGKFTKQAEPVETPKATAPTAGAMTKIDAPSIPVRNEPSAPTPAVESAQAGTGAIAEFPVSERVEKIVNEAVAKAAMPISQDIIRRMKVELTALETTINTIILSGVERKPIVIGHDTGLDLDATVVAQASEAYLEEYYGGKVIIVRGNAANLAQRIAEARAKLPDAAVVTIAGNEALAALQAAAGARDLKKVAGIVLNIQVNKNEPYIPFALLYNLAFKIAYDQLDDDTTNLLNLLNAFLGYVTDDKQVVPFTIDQLRQGIIRILPRAGRVNPDEAREAYKAAAQALRSL